MQEQFVTYEIADLLHNQLGFYEPCLGFYNEKCPENDKGGYSGQFTCMAGWCQGRYDTSDLTSLDFTIIAPLWSQALDFLREKHALLIIPHNDYYQLNDKTKVEYYFLIKKLGMATVDGVFTEKKEDYKEALIIAIKKAIELV